jgi:putative transposase
VQTDHHLIRCLSYIDLNMVRAGAVSHPREWESSGYHEIQSPRQRKGAIDHKVLCELLGVSTIEQLQHVHNDWVGDSLTQSRRDPIWTESVAVGDEHFLAALKEQLGPIILHRPIRHADDAKCRKEPDVTNTMFSGSKSGD